MCCFLNESDTRAEIDVSCVGKKSRSRMITHFSWFNMSKFTQSRAKVEDEIPVLGRSSGI